MASWPYWAAHANAGSLAAPVTHDVTSVMDFGIVLGTMTAAALAGRYAPVWKVPARSLIEAVIGGLMLGYGARLAYGCNIGAYFSGIRQPVRLVVAGRSFRRQRSRHAPAAGVRSRSGTCSPDRLQTLLSQLQMRLRL